MIHVQLCALLYFYIPIMFIMYVDPESAKQKVVGALHAPAAGGGRGERQPVQ